MPHIYSIHIYKTITPVKNILVNTHSKRNISLQQSLGSYVDWGPKRTCLCKWQAGVLPDPFTNHLEPSLNDFFFNVYFIVHLFVCVPSEARRYPIPRSWSYKWLWTNESGCWEPDLGPPLLPTEPSLQPCIFFPTYISWETHLHVYNQDWRDGSAVKNTNCSSRRLEFHPQHSYQVAHNYL